MDKVKEVTSLLINECNSLRATQPPLKSTATNKCAVIVETREHELLEPIIRNLFDKLEGWNLHIFCGTKNQDFITNLLPNWEYKITNTGWTDLKDEPYNKLLCQSSFWKEIKEEHVLIFQVDCLFLNGFNVEPFVKNNYSFIGPPYNFGKKDSNSFIIEDYVSPPNKNFSVNGGLSLRKRSSMLKCLEEDPKKTLEKLITWRQEHGLDFKEFTGTHIYVAEDIFFNNTLAFLGEKLPDLKTSQDFAFQYTFTASTGNHWQNALALHGWDKDYTCNESSVRFFLDKHHKNRKT